MPKPLFILWLVAVFIAIGSDCFAHNGKIAYARPLGNIKIDGDLSDWPKNAPRYDISTNLIDKPVDKQDFSGYFQTGYRLDNRSLYLAFTITDNDFIEDTTGNVAFNTQDGIELCLDARHLPFGSGVASFMYSKKLRNTNQSFYDPFAKNATWEIMEVAMKQQGKVRYYEWRITLGDQLAIDKSVGLDFQIFDMDNDGSFTGSGWGRGGYKFRSPTSLGDIVILPPTTKFGTLTGIIGLKTDHKIDGPSKVRITSVKNKNLWFDAEVDSTGKYATQLPTGKYLVELPDRYFQKEGVLYSYADFKSFSIDIKPSQKTTVRPITVSAGIAPDLIPNKGVLPDFNSSTPKQIDEFIETYRKYYGIAGVSLAVIKDARVAYYNTYGFKNLITGEKVDSTTLFEAASITKPVFAFAVQRLAERGVIDLDKPMYQYLPYPDIAYDERYKLMTGRHVLTHRTGFPNWRYMNPDNKLDLKFTPGTDYNYSGEGFEYLKMVVEKITGKKVEQVLQEEVIEPIGLYHTFFSRNDSLKALVANGHYDRQPVKDDLPDAPGMAYSMHTEAKIFTRFMLYLAEQKGLTSKMYDTMFSKHSEFTMDAGDEMPRYPSYMGMSLEIRETPVGKSFGHGGNNGDFLCQFEMYKDAKMGYVLFTNSDASNPLLEVIREFLVEGRDPKRDKIGK